MRFADFIKHIGDPYGPDTIDSLTDADIARSDRGPHRAGCRGGPHTASRSTCLRRPRTPPPAPALRRQSRTSRTRGSHACCKPRHARRADERSGSTISDGAMSGISA